jgi:photosystem II stability/assembly factor-like uncharacterized protein
MLARLKQLTIMATLCAAPVALHAQVSFNVDGRQTLHGQDDRQQREFQRDDQTALGKQLKGGRKARRADWYYRQRAFPFDRVPPDARLKAWRRKLEMDRQAADHSARPKTAAAGAWESIGPQPSTFWNGNSSGRVTALAVDPRSSQVAWAGTADGGVWKTVNGGTLWTPMTDEQSSLSTGAIALDPAHPDTVYVGTGEDNFIIDYVGGAGILKSTDGGATWTNTPGPFVGSCIGQIAIQPVNSQIVLVAATNGVFRSTDGGATWSNVLNGTASAVVFDPGGSIAWAAIGNPWGGASNGVYKSTDGGQTWSGVTGLSSGASVGRIAIAIAPSNPSLVYVGMAPPICDSTSTQLFVTQDGGAAWTAMPAPSYGGDWYRNALAVSPVNPLLLLGTAYGLNVSSDAGNTWNGSAVSIHPDQHAIAFSADGSVVYIGNDGGVYSTTDIANPQAAWADLGGTLSIMQFYPGLSLDATNPSVTLGGTQDNGTLQYTGSLTWGWVACGDGGETAIDPVSPNNMYVACSSGGVQKSTDGGVSTSDASNGFSASEGGPWVPALVIDPNNPQILYYGGNERIYQTQNGAESWQAITGDITNDSGNPPSALAVAPSDSATVYAGTSGGVLEVTNNANSGTASIWVNRSAGIPNRAITAIAVDPANSQLAYVTLSGTGSGHVFQTADGGATWADISTNLPDAPANDLALDPTVDGTIYLATDVGIFSASQAGGSWVPLGTGLPNVVVTGVRFHAATRTLRASTLGRGMWDLAIPGPLANPAITIQTSPTGLQFSIDNGAPQSAPRTMNLSPGNHTLSVNSTQNGQPGIQYAFTSWSDSGAAYHSITIAGPATYNATFQTQYQLTATTYPKSGGVLNAISGAYYNSGAAVTLTATPSAKRVFTGWSNGGAANPLQLTVNAPVSIAAYFDIPGATCTMTGDATASVADVQYIINEALGIVPPNNDLNGDGVVNIADVQIVANAVLYLNCRH